MEALDQQRPETATGGGALAIGVLGSLEVSVDGRPLVVTARRLRVLLAVLAVSAGETVSIDRLARAMWDEELPADARRTVQTYAARLRGTLGAGLIATSPTGYTLRAEPEQVDALRFDRLLDAAAAADGPVERERLAEALALWRGTPFEGVQSGWLRESVAPALVERYLAAVERRVDLDIAAGRAAELVAELTELTARHPLREPLWARLLVVLARCGRHAEALEGYERMRVRLAEELGTDPGSELQAVYADLLAGRTPGAGRHGGRSPARAVVPRQLPADIEGFTGRRAVLDALEELLGGAIHPDPGSVVISAIAGSAGIGKSALAIHAAHRLAERFPDGQLYVNLQGATAGLEPLAPLEVLGRFLRALGMEPGAVPSGVAEASAAFRTMVAGRRLLLLLDDAAGAAQVRPLLPASPGCRVLVTSRRLLAGLDGARHLHLEALTPEEATELLDRLAGQERTAAEPEAAAQVARLCGRLPLALRIAGARLAARPSWPVQELAGRLADAQGRLDELELAEIGVRASFAVSFEQLRTGDDPADRAAAEAFAVLGVLDGAEVGVPVAARLLGRAEEKAARVLERLVDAQLLETLSPGRYRLHDLLRLYARELARQHHSQSQWAAALTRALGFYVATAWRTLALLRPGDLRLARVDERWFKGGVEFNDAQTALRWLETERANLLAAVQQAAAAPGVLPAVAVQLAQALAGFFWVRSHWADWVQVNELALGVARRVGDRAAEAQANNDLGLGYWRQGRYEQAVSRLRETRAIWRELGDRWGEGTSLRNLGLVYEWQGRYDEALACQQGSLAIDRELGDRRGEASSLGNLGTVYGRQGRYLQALACQQESLAIYRELGDRQGEAIGLGNLGVAHERLGHFEQAVACLQESLSICRGLGDRDGQAYSLNDLGVVHRRQGRNGRALACQRESLAIRRELGDRYGQANSLRELGVTLRELSRFEEARVHLLEALAIFERLRTSDVDQVRSLLAELPARPSRPVRSSR